MATDRLLTYRQAAKAWGISEKAFRDRVARGAVPERVLFDRERGEGMRPERFVRAIEFRTWLGPGHEEGFAHLNLPPQAQG